MEQKTLSKEFKTVDEQNFELIETRQSTININIKAMPVYMKNMLSEIENWGRNIVKQKDLIASAVETYNNAIDDMQTGKEQLGMTFDIPEKLNVEDYYNFVEPVEEEEQPKK